MKFSLSLLAMFIAVTFSYAQNIFTDNGNVGIGTKSPANKLSVFETTNANVYATIGNYTVGTLIGAGGSSIGIVGTTSNHDLAIYTNLNEKMRVTSGGNVRVGTTTPTTTLYIQNAAANYSSTLTLKNTANNVASRAGMTMENDGGNQTMFYKQSSGNADANDVILYSAQGDTRIYTNGAERLRIVNSGNLGIGTINPDAKLAVNGTIHSTAVSVDLKGFSDYVFKPTYILPSLSSVNAFIKKYQHLPEVPSEQEVIKNGIDLGEMNKLLVKKGRGTYPVHY
jgi:hypothetical protein